MDWVHNYLKYSATCTIDATFWREKAAFTKCCILSHDINDEIPYFVRFLPDVDEMLFRGEVAGHSLHETNSCHFGGWGLAISKSCISHFFIQPFFWGFSVVRSLLVVCHPLENFG